MELRLSELELELNCLWDWVPDSELEWNCLYWNYNWNCKNGIDPSSVVRLPRHLGISQQMNHGMRLNYVFVVVLTSELPDYERCVFVPIFSR